MIKIILVMLVALLTSGCGGGGVLRTESDKLWFSGRYDELAKHTESNIAQRGVAETPELYRLCLAYSKLKRYDKLFPCLDRLEGNIRKGEKDAQEGSKIGGLGF